MGNHINIIDLFAGPGGLGEGFSAFRDSENEFPFKIRASIEKESSAHRTLQLRAFFRQFRETEVPDEYYEYIRNPNNLKGKKLKKLKIELFEKYKQQSIAAREETLETPQTLGIESSDKVIDKTLTRLLGEHENEHFVVIGGPPCQAYSIAGRSRNCGIDGYRIEDDSRASLYKEYLKVLYKVQPTVFIMENVKGILSARLDGKNLFPLILEHLGDPGRALNRRPKNKYHIYSLAVPPDDYHDDGSPKYNDPRSFTIRAEQHGVPQTRHRVILLGVREDINAHQTIINKTKSPTTVKSVIDGMPELRSGLSKGQCDGSEKWASQIKKAGESLAIALKRTNSNGHVSLINEYMANIRDDLSRGGRFVLSKNSGFKSYFRGPLKNWIYDPRLGGFPNHETKAHMHDDLRRYLWISTYAELTSYSPKSSDFPGLLAPNHRNWHTGDHADRFKVQASNKPSSTITCHLSKDGHSSIHYKPEQCRSFTVREAARIQTFPDNYFFEGTRTEQYVQVGNAVPPYLAKQIANCVFALLEGKN